jgi:hypothetical protein
MSQPNTGGSTSATTPIAPVATPSHASPPLIGGRAPRTAGGRQASGSAGSCGESPSLTAACQADGRLGPSALVTLRGAVQARGPAGESGC